MTNPTKFTEGSFVAVISTHWNRRVDGKRQIYKVHKNGNFCLLSHDGTKDPQQYRPTRYSGDHETAHRTGDHSYRSHLEPWSVAIEQEIRDRNARHRRDARRAAIVQALQPSNADLPEHVLHQIETAMKSAGYLLETNR